MEARQQDKRKGTAYIATFPSENGSLGHTSLYVVGPDGRSFQRSYFPSTRNNQHLIHNGFLGLFPVFGFITKGLISDVRYERGAPESIKKIEGLDYDAMVKENQEFNNKLENGSHFFSMRYNGFLNPVHWLMRMCYSYSNMLKESDRNPCSFTLDDSFSAFPISCDIKEPQETVTFGNCTDAVDRALQAGGVKLRQSTENRFYSRFFAHGHTPSRYKEDLDYSGAVELIDKPEALPQEIRTALEKGKEIYESRDFAQEQYDRERSASLRRHENFM